MTPFTLDQLAAILAAAEPIARRGNAHLGHSGIVEQAGFKDAAQFLASLGLLALKDFHALIDLAISGLPNDLSFEIRQQKINGRVSSLFDDVLNCRLPPSAILDALREFLARPGQTADGSGVETGIAPLVVAEQVPIDQPGVHQQGHMLGEDTRLDVVQPIQGASRIPGRQDHPSDQVHVPLHDAPPK